MLKLILTKQFEQAAKSLCLHASIRINLAKFTALKKKILLYT